MLVTSGRLTGNGVSEYGGLESELKLANGKFTATDRGRSVRTILSVDEIPTVIFCGSDLIAMGAMSALEDAGVKIPEDVSIVGIDDISFAFLARPPLTTISVPRERLGITAFQALDKVLKLKRHMGADYRLETELVIRRSTAPARQRKLRLSK